MTTQTPIRTSALALAFAFGVIVSSVRAQIPPYEPPASVEELPVERFDEYTIGAFPPQPWRRIGSPDVRFSLENSGESPFIANKITGKGLVLFDGSRVAGRNAGIEIAFAPPPSGRLYLGFDFMLGKTGEGLNLACELTDASGVGLRLLLGTEGGLFTGTSPVDLSPGQWYHLALDISASGEATISLTEFGKQPIVIGRMALAGSRGPFRSLRFLSSAPDERTGGWAIDNILMAGEVDAPRDALLPFKQVPLSELRISPRKVFAYYYEIYPSFYSEEDPGLGVYSRMVFNPSACLERSWLKDRINAGTELLYRPLPRVRMEEGLSKEEVLGRAMEEEVRLACQMGLDGFLLDFFAETKEAGGTATFNRRSFALLDAAAKVDPGFKIIPAIYAGAQPEISISSGKTSVEIFAERYSNSPFVQAALRHPQALRLADGRVVFSMWGTERHNPEAWRKTVEALKRKGISAAFVGQFNGLRREALKPYSSICYGMSDWGPRTPSDYHWVPRVRDLTSVVISSVVFQDVRTRGCEYCESAGSDAFRKMWRTAMEDHSDWVFIHTWSDYSEQAQAPSTSIGFSIHDLNTYYTQWFKTEAPPPINRDVLYYFYRRHHTEIDPGRGIKWKLKQGEAPKNEIELLGFLKEPGELQIVIGDTVHRQKADAGITSFKVPLPLAKTLTPVFSLVRDGKMILSKPGRYAILEKIEFPNLLYHGGVIAGGE